MTTPSVSFDNSTGFQQHPNVVGKIYENVNFDQNFEPSYLDYYQKTHPESLPLFKPSLDQDYSLLNCLDSRSLTSPDFQTNGQQHNIEDDDEEFNNWDSLL